jgi:hypothetical protein
VGAAYQSACRIVHWYAVGDVSERVWGLAVRVWGLTVRVWGLTVRVWGLTVRVWGLTVRVWGLTVRVDVDLARRAPAACARGSWCVSGGRVRVYKELVSGESFIACVAVLYSLCVSASILCVSASILCGSASILACIILFVVCVLPLLSGGRLDSQQLAMLLGQAQSSWPCY